MAIGPGSWEADTEVDIGMGGSLGSAPGDTRGRVGEAGR